MRLTILEAGRVIIVIGTRIFITAFKSTHFISVA